jgi:hypothetical protein
MNTTIIALALSAAPSTPTDRAPAFEVADVEIEPGQRSTSITAFDSEGEVSAEIVVWLDADDRPRLDVNFADGLYLRSFDDSAETDNAAEVAARAQAIAGWLAENQAQANWREWGACGLSFAVAVVECTGGGPLGCGIGGVLVACECLPLFTDVECV